MSTDIISSALLVGSFVGWLVGKVTKRKERFQSTRESMGFLIRFSLEFFVMAHNRHKRSYSITAGQFVVSGKLVLLLLLLLHCEIMKPTFENRSREYLRKLPGLLLHDECH